MLSSDEQMQPGFVGFKTLAQGFGFEARELKKKTKKKTGWILPRLRHKGGFKCYIS